MILIEILLEDLLEILKVAIPATILFVFDRFLSRKLYALSDQLGISKATMKSILTLVRVALLGMLIIALLSLKWVPKEYFVGGSIIVSTLIAFAISKFITNFASGAYTLLAGAVKVGDYVNIAGNEGLIIDMTVNRTKIKRDDGIIVTIPNKDVLEKVIVNYTVDGTHKYPFEVKLRADTILRLGDVAKKLSKEFGAEVEYFVKSLSKDDIIVAFIVSTKELEKLLDIKKRFYEELYKALSSA